VPDRHAISAPRPWASLNKAARAGLILLLTVAATVANAAVPFNFSVVFNSIQGIAPEKLFRRWAVRFVDTRTDSANMSVVTSTKCVVVNYGSGVIGFLNSGHDVDGDAQVIDLRHLVPFFPRPNGGVNRDISGYRIATSRLLSHPLRNLVRSQREEVVAAYYMVGRTQPIIFQFVVDLINEINGLWNEPIWVCDVSETFWAIDLKAVVNWADLSTQLPMFLVSGDPEYSGSDNGISGHEQRRSFSPNKSLAAILCVIGVGGLILMYQSFDRSDYWGLLFSILGYAAAFSSFAIFCLWFP